MAEVTFQAPRLESATIRLRSGSGVAGTGIPLWWLIAGALVGVAVLTALADWVRAEAVPVTAVVATAAVALPVGVAAGQFRLAAAALLSAAGLIGWVTVVLAVAAGWPIIVMITVSGMWIICLWIDRRQVRAMLGITPRPASWRWRLAGWIVRGQVAPETPAKAPTRAALTADRPHVDEVVVEVEEVR